ncbi:MAG: hypothetical protein AAF961_15100, partial [Planctomycetota bacterium]
QATAEAAREKLTELMGSVGGMEEQLGALPGEAKTAVTGVIEQGMAALQALYEKLASKPEIQDVVKPKVEELMAKLKSMTSS